jgi:hypothetical protein
MLCYHCLQLFRVCQKRLVLLQAEITHHPTLESLYQSTQLDCELCSTLHEFITSKVSNRSPFDTQNDGRRFTWCIIRPVNDEVAVHYRNEIARLDSYDISRPSGRIFSLDFYMSGSHFVMGYRLEAAKGKSTVAEVHVL